MTTGEARRLLSGVWIGPTSGIPYRAERVTGAFIVGSGGGGSCGFLVQDGFHGDPGLDTCAEKLGVRLSEIEWKLVGCETTVRELAEQMAGHGARVSKRQERVLPFELWFSPKDGRVLLSKDRKLRVLVVDDSKTIQTLLGKIIEGDPALEVVGAAETPSEAEEMIERLRPDVLTLDIHLPEMDGVAFLKKIFPKHQVPAVMISSVTREEGPYVLDALEQGAVDYIHKPERADLEEVAATIVRTIRTAALSNTKARTRRAGITAEAASPGAIEMDPHTLIAIGSSTGGVEALRDLLARLPAKIPPIVITQHIPPVFSAALAARLRQFLPFDVQEARDGDVPKAGQVLVAPGGTQMTLNRKQGQWVVKVDPSAPAVNRHKPSVDALFESIAAHGGKDTIGVILTGMGADGAKGLLGMKKAGARTFAQDEASCVVFGMPREAIRLGAADEVLSLTEIPAALIRLLGRKKAA